MEVMKIIKKTLQILAIVMSSLFLLTIPASLVFVAIGSKVGTVVTLSLTLISLVFISVAANAASLEEESEVSYGEVCKNNGESKGVCREIGVNDRRGKQKFKGN